ncbi:MAG TPA: glutaconyl-CoA decarboxylase subunit beta [Porphyromonadaceae bacterium]|jgi:oxaloacetate decarboxylase beta subunit|uniref:sodium ion-translocating decarboxylase subunit beta n=1 Tax=Petrimonas TaxID=307628 RepID=UPI000E8EB187|nr:sodium ion-translocating decarboxylase subunit beta [Petrimonas sp.]NLU29153.1 sodium ion-translocating decarboxylase subunit beta [Bacteroidales bacterium]BBD44877.1 Na+-transporting methylmalonyl-CoA/oxaloacetatedecarboxylase subunit beta [Petrimonas sp. IBARAKI]HAC73111.1 glutaconyl-CoA decarboxylase subunit beta [Porphyromonadaceae bacterium]MDD3541307.1 sodium ion-translocating decarboxylase subunit beta [Petrimonas sp.]
MGFEQLMPAVAGMTWQDLVMITIGLILIYLAIAKNYEPTLLLPMGFGAILVNIPLSSAITQIDPATGEAVEGVLNVFFQAGIATEIFPLLIFIAIGAMIDFSPLFRSPSLLLFGAAAQFGIFMTMVLASFLGYDLREAASIGIIGAADGPTSIVVASRFAPNLLGPISVAAYSYMALVPIIQPPVIRLLTSKKERLIRMSGTGHANKRISKKALIAFPIVVTIVAGIIAPSSLALIGFLMFGNLIRECGVLNKLSLSAQNELASLVTILLGITIASTMTSDRFVRVDTLLIIALGLFAFVFDTFGGVIFAKFLNLFRKEGNKINPMIGACGISAFPMSARVIHQMGQKEDPYNYLLMPAISANVGGQIGSVVAGGIILTLVPLFA